jgi:hypothetical protein
VGRSTSARKGGSGGAAEVVQPPFGYTGSSTERLEGADVVAGVAGLAQLVGEHPVPVCPGRGTLSLDRLGLAVGNQLGG